MPWLADDDPRDVPLSREPGNLFGDVTARQGDGLCAQVGCQPQIVRGLVAHGFRQHRRPGLLDVRDEPFGMKVGRHPPGGIDQSSRGGARAHADQEPCFRGRCRVCHRRAPSPPEHPTTVMPLPQRRRPRNCDSANRATVEPAHDRGVDARDAPCSGRCARERLSRHAERGDAHRRPAQSGPSCGTHDRDVATRAPHGGSPSEVRNE